MIDIIPKDYELPLYLFHNGTNCETYKFLGCHKGEKDGVEKDIISESGQHTLRAFLLWEISMTGTKMPLQWRR